jgi:hypothetical protein
MNIHLETDRIILRQFKVSDAKSLYSICNQQYILKGRLIGKDQWRL